MELRATIRTQVPSKSNSYKIVNFKGHSTLAKTNRLVEFENAFFWECGELRNKNISVPFRLSVKVYYSSLRLDIDNSLKILLDCLQKARTIKNDNLCYKVEAEKFRDKVNPRVELELYYDE